jgi:hypothetical protein
MLAGAVLSLSRVSLAVAVEGRDARRRVAVVDNRQDTTDTAAIPSEREPERGRGRGTEA